MVNIDEEFRLREKGYMPGSSKPDVCFEETL